MRSEAGGGKLEGLQAARAIAALSVAYFHSYVALRGFPEDAQHPIPFLKAWGFLGVDFFFAISGFVICLVASKPDFAPTAFAIKRLFRLYPMYWVAMAIVAVLILEDRFPDTIDLGRYLYSMTLLPQHGPSAYQVSWTLERELVFYALVAIIVPFAGIAGLAVVLAGLAWAGFVYHDPWSFHLVSIRQGDFLGGVLVFLFSRRIRLASSTAGLALAAGVFALGYLWFVPSRIFPFATAICLALVLLGMINLRLPWEHWSLRWLVMVGNASFSIYLLHGLLLYYGPWFSAKLGNLPAWLCEPWRFAMLAVTCVLSYATWQLIELPMISFGNRLIEPPEDMPAEIVAPPERA
ncbi:acyltransferase [Bradyrhizobium sp. Ash2021]|uniref:acyltransferase family protein n=1 Tax=Bradyrhizobium sp. Ash2021 TaxID=2954771 RepID=UPI002815FEC2|nr:acyltransferase [Bradyrhizobium sp. Ash2021]WMT75802.1 acyltransferase [Bradyrhizobium sp. Ash2021]